MSSLLLLAEHNAEPCGRRGEPQCAEAAALAQLSQSLYGDPSLDGAEEAIKRAGDALGMRWAWWTPDAAHPYNCPRAEQFSRQSGWPLEVMRLWRENHIMLYSPFHIRARFETLPFVTQPDLRNSHQPRVGYARLNKVLSEMGVAALLHVPVHLPKGRIGLVNWAGNRDPAELRRLLAQISGELLAIGHLFMRSYDAEFGQDQSVIEEKSRLTLREWDCLRMLALGYREAEAAELLHISKSTLRFHIENVVRKFGCKNRTHAIATAAQLGLLGPVGN